jgi:hypothetical protein
MLNSYNVKLRRPGRTMWMLLGPMLFVMSAVTTVHAVPGDLVANVPLTVPGFGVSIAVGCSPTALYYTLENDNLLYSMDKTGAPLASVPILTASGGPIVIDEMSYDIVNDVLWGVEHNSNPENVWKINRTTGLATFAFTSATVSVGSFRDGLAVDASDQTLWISGDVSTTIEHYTLTGVLLGVITPTDAAGVALGDISGVSAGIGDLLYLGRNGLGQIVRVKKSDGSFISSFASPGGRDEGLECDATSFAPKLVLWSRDFFSPGFVDAIELEPGTCACGGVTPARQSSWGSLKARYH